MFLQKKWPYTPAYSCYKPHYHSCGKGETKKGTLWIPFCRFGEDRTHDPMIKSHVLYQLSYEPF